MIEGGRGEETKKRLGSNTPKRSAKEKEHDRKVGLSPFGESSPIRKNLKVQRMHN